MKDTEQAMRGQRSGCSVGSRGPCRCCLGRWADVADRCLSSLPFSFCLWPWLARQSPTWGGRQAADFAAGMLTMPCSRKDAAPFLQHPFVHTATSSPCLGPEPSYPSGMLQHRVYQSLSVSISSRQGSLASEDLLCWNSSSLLRGKGRGKQTLNFLQMKAI